MGVAVVLGVWSSCTSPRPPSADQDATRFEAFGVATSVVENRAGDLVLLSVDTRKEDVGAEPGVAFRVWFKGTMRNDTDYTIYAVEATVTIRDRERTVVEQFDDYIFFVDPTAGFPSPLRPGQTITGGENPIAVFDYGGLSLKGYEVVLDPIKLTVAR